MIVETKQKEEPMFKKSILAIAIAVSVSFGANAAEIGKPAPEFAAKDITGKEQSIAQYKGKIVVLEWTNPECPFVKKHYETKNMQELQEYAASKDVQWLTVNSSAPGKQGNLDAAAAAAQVKEVGNNGSAYIIDADGKIGKAYGAKATPHLYVIDAEGKLAYQGAIDDKPTHEKEDVKTAKNYIRAAIDSLLAGKPVETADTKAYGCGVKYAE